MIIWITRKDELQINSVVPMLFNAINCISFLPLYIIHTFPNSEITKAFYHTRLPNSFNFLYNCFSKPLKWSELISNIWVISYNSNTTKDILRQLIDSLILIWYLFTEIQLLISQCAKIISLLNYSHLKYLKKWL